MNNLENYIKYLCDLMKMELVPIEMISAQEMQQISSENTLACYNRVTNTVFIEKKNQYEMMDYYLLSHELRHAWQERTNSEYYFGQCIVGMSEHEYNVTNAELDANAFACVAIAKRFGIITKRTYKTDKMAQDKYTKLVKQLAREYKVKNL